MMRNTWVAVLMFGLSRILWAQTMISYSGVLRDQNGTVSGGKNIRLEGLNIATKTAANGSFTLTVPANSSRIVFEAGDNDVNYKYTYTACITVGDQNVAGASHTIVSKSTWTDLNKGNIGDPVAHSSPRGHILGKVQDSSGAGISGVTAVGRYADTGDLVYSEVISGTGAQRRYLDTTTPFPVPRLSLNSTSASGMFVFYNVDLDRPVVVTAEKAGSTFTSALAVVRTKSVTTVTLLQDSSGRQTLSGRVYDDRGAGSRVGSAAVSVPGAGLSTTSAGDGAYSFPDGVFPYSPVLVRAGKVGHVDTLAAGFTEGQPLRKDLALLRNEYYAGVLAAIGRNHTAGAGDILGNVGAGAGVQVRLYDGTGVETTVASGAGRNVFYAGENGVFDPSLSGTSSHGGFVIVNVGPNLWHLTGTRQGDLFPLQGVGVSANRVTLADSLRIPAVGAIAVRPGVVRFHGVASGTSAAPATVQVRNEGTADLVITGEVAWQRNDGNCFSIRSDTVSNAVIPAGQTRTLEVVFTQDGAGAKYGTVAIPSNDETRNPAVVELSGTEREKGDVTGDGGRDIADVIVCLRMALGLVLPEEAFADMNDDGMVDIADVLTLLVTVP